MRRLALVACVTVAVALVAIPAWRQHLRARARPAAIPAPVVATTRLPAPARDTRGRHVRDDGARPPLGAEPSHDEIDQLLRRMNDQFNRDGGMPLRVTQTGDRLPNLFLELRGFRHPKPCEAHDGPTEHPHWHCLVEYEWRSPSYQPDFKWDTREYDFSRYPDGGIDTLQQVVRVERGEDHR